MSSDNADVTTPAVVEPPAKPAGPKRPKTPEVGKLTLDADTLAVLKQCGFNANRVEREARKVVAQFDPTDARAHVALKSTVNVELTHIVRDAFVSMLSALILKAVGGKGSDDL